MAEKRKTLLALPAEEKRVEVTVTEEYFCPALAQAVNTMQKAEEDKTQCGFGESGRSAVGEEAFSKVDAALGVANEDFIASETAVRLGNARGTTLVTKADEIHVFKFASAPMIEQKVEHRVSLVTDDTKPSITSENSLVNEFLHIKEKEQGEIVMEPEMTGEISSTADDKALAVSEEKKRKSCQYDD